MCYSKVGSASLLFENRQLSAAERTQVESDLKEILAKEIEKLHKIRIRLDSSRTVFGVCDTSETLEYGQVNIYSDNHSLFSHNLVFLSPYD